MKDAMFFIALIIAVFIAIKLMLWAVGKIIIIALVVGAVYVGLRMMRSRKTS